MVATFGYWLSRGLGNSIKYLLEYTGTEYKEKQYEVGPAPDFDRSQWTNEKFSFGMDFPNLPYYFDGEYKISQSHVILKHLARKHNLVGKTEGENVRVDTAEHEGLDLRIAYYMLVYSTKSEFENTKESYRTGTLKSKLENFSKFLGDHPWFAGETLTYVDFLLYELFEVNRILFSNCFDDFDNLKKYLARFEALGPIKKYMSSSRFLKSPSNNPAAAFIG